MTDAAPQTNWKPMVLGFAAIAGGFALSFLGFGLLWIGTPWEYQLLMGLPFLALSFAVTRIGGAGMQACLLIVCGALPLGTVIPMFRDKNDSHVMSILIVCGWAAGIAAGYYLGKKRKPEQARRSVIALALTVLLLGSAACQHSIQQPVWTPLFNGQDLAGWKHVGPGEFVVQEGLLKTVGGMGLLWYSGNPFGDVQIRVVYRNPGGANSGVFIRIPEPPIEPRMPINRGYEVQIDDLADDYHKTGVLYALTRAAVRPVRPDEWNTMEITLDQDRTVVVLNGVPVTDYREGDPVPPKEETRGGDRGPRPLVGYLGLQNHGDGDTVFFREVSIRPLR